MDRPTLQCIPEDCRRHIDAALSEIERAHDVRLVFAIESGSRAWGFPSPDSDYDVRFVYVNRPEWYVSVQTPRDVIELPFDGVYDINGWDIRKTLGLARKHNPVLSEWLAAPIVYRQLPELFVELRNFVASSNTRPTALHHYYSLGNGAFRRDIVGRDGISLKKYFYSLRPTLALRWLRMKPSGIPPMDLPTLIDGIDLSQPEKVAIAELVTRKSTTREMGSGSPVALLDDLIARELAYAEAEIAKGVTPPTVDLAQADALLRKMVRGIWAQP